MVIVPFEAISLTKKIRSSGVRCVISDGIIIVMVLMDILMVPSVFRRVGRVVVCMKMFVIALSGCPPIAHPS